MKHIVATTVAFFILVPTVTFAGWQVATPDNAVPDQPFFQAGSEQDNTFPVQNGEAISPGEFAGLGRPAETYAISVSGSLKENIERIMARYHWKVLWKAPYDYNFDGRVTGANLPDVMKKLLAPFPLQANLYMSNRTMTVVARETPVSRETYASS